MHTLKKLAREIHRHSVLQVLVTYALISAAVYFGLGAASAPLGRPLWTTRMAVVLLLIGLPIVTATTVAEGGLPWLRIEDAEDPNELKGRTPDEVHVIPGAHPLSRLTVLTWRNAILGGAMAAALLVTSVVAYLTMWALGIGPVGSLMAQGMVQEGDRVLYVEPFDGPQEGRDASEALRAHFFRTAVVDVVPPPTDSELTLDAALDYARELGISIVVTGEVTADGNGVDITGRVFSTEIGQVAAFDERARARGDAVDAAELVSIRLREKIGESLRSIRSD